LVADEDEGVVTATVSCYYLLLLFSVAAAEMLWSCTRMKEK